MSTLNRAGLSIVVDRALKDEFGRICKKDHLSQTEVIETFLINYISKRLNEPMDETVNRVLMDISPYALSEQAKKEALIEEVAHSQLDLNGLNKLKENQTNE